MSKRVKHIKNQLYLEIDKIKLLKIEKKMLFLHRNFKRFYLKLI